MGYSLNAYLIFGFVLVKEEQDKAAYLTNEFTGFDTEDYDLLHSTACYDECSYAIGCEIASSYFTSWAEVKNISAQDENNMRAALQKFCEKYKFTYQEPKILLGASYT